MADNNLRIGQIVRSWMAAKKRTQIDVAQFLGITQPSVSEMLAGNISIPKDKLVPLIDWFAPSDEDRNEVINLFLGTTDVKYRSVVAEERAPYGNIRPDQPDQPDDPLLAELQSIWPGLTKAGRHRLLALAHELLEGSVQKHAGEPSGSVADERRERQAAG